MDYGFSEKRKNKNDRRAKSRFNKFKRGGRFRTTNVNLKDKSDKSDEK